MYHGTKELTKTGSLLPANLATGEDFAQDSFEPGSLLAEQGTVQVIATSRHSVGSVQHSSSSFGLMQVSQSSWPEKHFHVWCDTQQSAKIGSQL